MRPFRPSLRNTVATAAFLAFATWLVLRVALRLDARLATVATVSALGALAALRLGFFRGAHALHPDEQGLVIRTARETRTVAWTAIQRIQLAYGEVETSRGLATVQYARLQLEHGPPIAFADLSALDGAEVVLEQEPAVVYDVSDPEVLLGIVAEHIGAREFFPRAAPTAASARRSLLGGVGSVLVLVRGGVLCLLAADAIEVLWNAGTSYLAAAAVGATLAMVCSALVEATSNRVRGEAGRDSAALSALTVTLLGTSAAALIFHRGDPSVMVDWAVGCGLALALPVAPLPGVALARAAGFFAAGRPSDRFAAAMIAVTGAVCAVLLSRGMKLVPLALLGATLEGSEAYMASLRAARLARAPRFARWSADALAELRAMLRASFPDAGAQREHDIDRAALRRVESMRRHRTPPASRVWVAVLAVVLAATVARKLLHDGTDAPHAAHVLLR